MLDLRIAEEAREDLDRIWIYTDAHYGDEAANSYLRGLNGLFDLLRDNPVASSVVPGILPLIRSFGYRQHRAYYRIGDHRIEIVRIAHKAQNASLFFK